VSIIQRKCVTVQYPVPARYLI